MSYQPATPPNADEAKQKIYHDLELEDVVLRAARNHKWDSSLAQKAEQHYRDFLWLYWNHLYNQLPEVDYLSPQADEVWHYHVLTTRKYHVDCDMMFGGQHLHHTPLDVNTPRDVAAEDTAKGLYKRFGLDVPEELVRQCMW